MGATSNVSKQFISESVLLNLGCESRNGFQKSYLDKGSVIMSFR